MTVELQGKNANEYHQDDKHVDGNKEDKHEAEHKDYSDKHEDREERK